MRGSRGLDGAAFLFLLSRKESERGLTVYMLSVEGHAVLWEAIVDLMLYNCIAHSRQNYIIPRLVSQHTSALLLL